ncbi:MAG: DUF3857 domain-containing protein [Cyclobacteriaceae bacterium]
MKPIEEFEYYKKKYEGEVAICLKKYRNADLKIVADSLVITVDTYEEYLYLTDNPRSFVKDNIYHSSFGLLSDIDAYTLVPGKKKYSKIPVEEFKEAYDKNSDVFYDDTKETSFYYPALGKGTKSVIRYRKTITDPHMMGLFYFQDYFPVEEAKYTLTYDSSISIDLQQFNLDGFEIKQSKTTLEGQRIRDSYWLNEVNKLDYEPNSPSYNYLAPSVYPLLKSFMDSKGTNQPVLGSVDDLYGWYQSFISKLQTDNSEIKKVVDEIVSEDDSDLEKVKKIYYWVQANIKYIAFEDGMRGLIPHTCDYVYSKRYGDCKDMSSIIIGMLREAGVKANFTWVGTRKLPYDYSLTPAPIVDNHMIATFSDNGKTYFLDATGMYTPLHLPTSMIQGKECLVGDGKKLRIENIPIIPKEDNLMIDSVSIELQNGIIQGSGSARFIGYPQVFNKYKLIKTNERSVEKYLNRLLGKGSNKSLITKYGFKNLDSMDAPLQIDYEFNVPDYHKEIAGEIYINLMMDRSWVDGVITERKRPLKNDYFYTTSNVVRLKIPDGYETSFVPPNKNIESENFGYSITYTKKDSELIAEKKFYLNYLILEPEEFDKWNEIITDYSNNCRQAVILSKI